MLFKILIILLLLLRGLLVNSQELSPTDSTSDIPHDKVEIEAYYRGGESAWRKFIEENIDILTPLKNGAPSGKYTVWVSYAIGKDGKITDIKQLTEFGYGMEDEFIRVLKEAKPWIPATLNGRPVKSFRRQPVTFITTTDKFDIRSKVPYELFTGIDNTLSVRVKHVKSKYLELKISHGQIIPVSDGKFIARVETPGRILINIFNKKKNENIGSVSFEVKKG